MDLNFAAVVVMGGYVIAIVVAGLVLSIGPGGGPKLAHNANAGRPQRFAVGDVVRLSRRGRPLARVARVGDDGRLSVFVMELLGGPMRWTGPRVVELRQVTNNYGPLDDVGIGAKMTEH